MPSSRLELELFDWTWAIFYSFEITPVSVSFSVGLQLIRPWQWIRQYRKDWRFAYPWCRGLPSPLRPFSPPGWTLHRSTRYSAETGRFTARVDGLPRCPEYLQGFAEGYNAPVETALSAAFWAKESSTVAGRRDSTAELLALPAGRNLIRLLSPHSTNPLLAETFSLGDRQALAAGHQLRSERLRGQQ